MPLTRTEKEAYVASMADKLRDVEAVVLSDFRGLDVTDISQLRRNLREVDAEFRVAKNTLMLLAFREAGVEPPIELLEGPTAYTVVGEDLAGPTKVLVDFAKSSDFLTIKGGIMGGEPIDVAAVEALAALPTRDELLAQFVGTIQAPMQQLVTVFAAPMRDFLTVLDAHVREEAGAEA